MSLALPEHPGQAPDRGEPGHPHPGPRRLHGPEAQRQGHPRPGANIFTQWVGDPDALGSAVLLNAILTELGAKEVRILTGSLGHPQNRNLVARCGIELHDPNKDRLPRGLHCMVDTSPPLGHVEHRRGRPGQGLLLRGRPPRRPRGGRGELPGPGRAPGQARRSWACRWARPRPSWR